MTLPGLRILFIWKTDEEYLYLQYFSSLYRLCLKNGVLEKKSDETWSDQLYFNEAMAIYHFLYYTKDIPVISGSWVPSQTVDGVVSRRPTADPLLDPFARKYSGKLEELRMACEQAGGTKLDIGDVGYEFEASAGAPSPDFLGSRGRFPSSGTDSSGPLRNGFYSL